LVTKEEHSTEISNDGTAGKSKDNQQGTGLAYFGLPDKGLLKCFSAPLNPLAFNSLVTVLLILALLK